MTFSASVKEELEGIISPARHCQIAELYIPEPGGIKYEQKRDQSHIF